MIDAQELMHQTYIRISASMAYTSSSLDDSADLSYLDYVNALPCTTAAIVAAHAVRRLTDRHGHGAETQVKDGNSLIWDSTLNYTIPVSSFLGLTNVSPIDTGRSTVATVHYKHVSVPLEYISGII
jgi:hypothetical protein